MEYALKPLKNAPISNKRIILRVDADVDIKDGKILDDTRLLSAIGTIQYILSHNPKEIVIIGHLGRPERKYQASNLKSPKIESEFSLEPVAKWIAKKLAGELKEVKKDSFPAWRVKENVSLLENMRFFKGEEECSQEFSKILSDFGDIFVNEAFAVAHRKQASNYGLAKILPSYAGLHFVTEINELAKIMKNPKRPLVVIIGGAKIETKLPMAEKMHSVADFVLVGGEVASHTKELIHIQHEKIAGHKSTVLVADLKVSGLDITDMSTENFIQVIQQAATVVWNGPLGQTGHDPENEQSTKKIAKAIIKSRAYSVVGGGDTLSFLKQHNLLEKFNFVSTGGGAMLEFLSGKKLPAIEALTQ